MDNVRLNAVDSGLEGYKEAIIRDTRALLSIPSVKGSATRGAPFGRDVKAALDFALQTARGLGLKAVDMDGYIGYIEAGKGTETLGVLAHLDVVPATGAWSYPPFEAQVAEGRIYARGAIDNKGPAMAAIYALAAVNGSMKLGKRVRIILGCDEESGWGCMEHYQKHEKLPDTAFSPDAEYPVINTEKGIIHCRFSMDIEDGSAEGLTVTGGARPNMVPDSAECRAQGRAAKLLAEAPDIACVTAEKGKTLKLSSQGKSAHGSMPEKGINAIWPLVKCLDSAALGGQAGEFIRFCHKSLCFLHGEGLGLDETDFSGRTSSNLGLIDINSHEASATVDIRHPLSISPDEVMQRLNACLIKGMKAENIGGHAPHHVPEDSPLVQTLLSVYTRITGRAGKCIAIGGGTYARAIPSAVAFGPLMPGAPELAHQPDEYISIEELLMNARIYAHCIAELAGE